LANYVSLTPSLRINNFFEIELTKDFCVYAITTVRTFFDELCAVLPDYTGSTCSLAK
jgi:hypothetical protein